MDTYTVFMDIKKIYVCLSRQIDNIQDKNKYNILIL